MNNSAQGFDPMEVMTTFASFSPWIMALIMSGFGIVGLWWIVNGLWSIRELDAGRSDKSLGSCLSDIAFGAGAIVLTSVIAFVGKASFGLEPSNAAELLYDAKAAGNMTKAAVGAMLLLIQLVGIVAVCMGWMVMRRLSNGRPQSGETWAQGITYFLAGVACVYIHWTVGFVSALFNLGIAQFLNSL